MLSDTPSTTTAKRAAIRQLYTHLDPTMEWAENNYYHLPIQQQLADQVPVSQFWLDYARHDGKSPFLSRNVAEASRNFTEMMCALAVLDLPFEAPKHEVVFKDGRMTLTPAGPAIAFHEEVRPVMAAGGQTPILISQNFFREGSRYREENGERIDQFVTGEFLANTVYGCQVVVTNPTSSRQKLSVLLQLPVGAIAASPTVSSPRRSCSTWNPIAHRPLITCSISPLRASSLSCRCKLRRTSNSSRPPSPPASMWSKNSPDPIRLRGIIFRKMARPRKC